MEDLNKNQIILLALLVSFVTSIATGIMTVSLLQQAPLEVTRTINSIVEKTVQTVTPAPTPTNSNTTVVSTPKQVTTTIVVNEDDSVTQAITKNLPSIARIKDYDPIAENTTFYGMGIVISSSGIIAADRNTITVGDTYTATMSDGTELNLLPLGVDKKTNFILFQANKPQNLTLPSTTPQTPYIFIPVTLGQTAPVLGQTLIGIGGQTLNATAVGRVTSLETKDQTVGTTTTQVLSAIDTDLSTKDLVDGSPVLNLSGEVVGVKLSDDAEDSFTPISVLESELNILEPAPAVPTQTQQ